MMDWWKMAGRLFRVLILVLFVIVLWKVWDLFLPRPVKISITQQPIMLDSISVDNGRIPLDDMEVPVHTTVIIYLYYEALCPDSRSFIMHQLRPTYQQLSEIMDVRLIPYGKASTHESNGKVSFTCQHGQLECDANKVHACVISTVKETSIVIDIVDCMIDNNFEPLEIGEKCVRQHEQNWESVKKCYHSERGDDLLIHMGVMTHSLKPPITFIPTITMDGSQDGQTQMFRKFKQTLCKRYKGPPLEGCS